MSVFKNIESRLTTYILNRADKSSLWVEMLKRGNSLIKSIIPTPFSNTTQDLRKWKLAKAAAESATNPSRNALYDIYDNVMLDLHLTSVVETIALKLKGKKFYIADAAGKPDEEKTKLLQKQWFNELIELYVLHYFWGPTVIELFETDEQGQLITVDPVPYKNVLPEKRLIIKQAGDTTGYDYTAGSFVNYYVQAGKSKHLGLLLKIAPMIMYKRWAIQAWSDFTVRLVEPFRTIKTPSTDPKRLAELAKIAEQAGPSGWAVLQADEIIDLLQMQTDAYETFEKLIQLVDSQVSKAALAQDGTSTKGDAGTYGAVKVLNEVGNEKHEAIAVDFMYFMNGQVLRRLNAGFAYPFGDQPFCWNKLSKMNAGELIKNVATLSQSGYVTDMEYITQETGIPIIQYIPPGGSSLGKDQGLDE